jgi:putative two-component system response regulator
LKRNTDETYMTVGSVLVLDDDSASLALLQELLALSGFQVFTAGEGRAGIEVFVRSRPELVITDIRMPHMDGLEFLQSIREVDEITPVIVVTGHGDLNYAMKALRRGAYDFLLKPINPDLMLNAARKAVEHCRLKRFEQDHRRLLEQEVANRTRELARTNEFLRKVQASSVFALAKLAESRDGETGYHLTRMQAYCRALSRELVRHKRFQKAMTEQFVEDLVQCSVLHDVGKVAIPDSILFNPRKFGIDEFEIMKQHAIHGGKALEEAAKEIGDEQSYLSLGKDVAYYHHEHWDGTGYPFGLKGEEIPLAARIVAIADVYDALTSERRYKLAFTHVEAVRMIAGLKGRQFDPELVDAFLEVAEEFRSIRDSNREAASGELFGDAAS